MQVVSICDLVFIPKLHDILQKSYIRDDHLKLPGTSYFC